MIATVGKFLSYTLGGEAGEIESVCSFFFPFPGESGG